MELADFFAIDRLSQHDEEMLIESAMQMQQMMMLYESGSNVIRPFFRITCRTGTA